MTCHGTGPSVLYLLEGQNTPVHTDPVFAVRMDL
jgi:hypothetical protein